MPSDSDHVSYAEAVVSRLWPDAGRPTIGSLPPSRHQNDIVGEWFLLPNPRQPTLLVPTGVPQASRMLQRHGDRLLPRFGRSSLAKAIDSGLIRLVPLPRLRVPTGLAGGTGASVLDYIAQFVPDVAVCGLILGTPRPNRKPVLQLFGVDGATVGFAKIGTTESTRHLIRAEAANLGVVSKAGVRSLEIPMIRHHGAFHQAEVLVLSVLASSQKKRRQHMPLAAMRELAHLSATQQQNLASTEYWSNLTHEISDLSGTPGAAEANDILGLVSERWGDAPVELGSWHGDWAPWNMGYRGDVVQLWDWERFSSPVPIGFDAIHFAAQQVRHNRSDTGKLESELSAQTSQLLSEMGSSTGAREPRLIMVLYLLTLSVRFMRMAAESEDRKLHPRGRWSLDFAGRVVTGQFDSTFRVH